jgi:transposase
VEGHRQPKLKAEHAGPVAKYLVEHPSAKVKPILAYIKKDLDVEVDRLTLRRFFKRYGLGCLRGDLVTDTPLF